jgi:hypothetical protein
MGTQILCMNLRTKRLRCSVGVGTGSPLYVCLFPYTPFPFVIPYDNFIDILFQFHQTHKGQDHVSSTPKKTLEDNSTLVLRSMLLLAHS